jgi:hypothetical protein
VIYIINTVPHQMYKNLCSNGVDQSFKHLWKAKLPLKIKIWLWLIWHNAIASKDNMSKRGWTRNTKCQFCNEEETILHMFFTCAAANFFWSGVAKSIGAHNRPASFSQFFWWFPQFFPASRNVQIAGVLPFAGLSGNCVTRHALKAN